MNKQDSLIREATELLREVRAKVQGDVEDSVIQKLDEVIGQLEEIGRTEYGRQANQKALELLGVAIKWLPMVAKLIELLHHGR